MKVLEKRGNQYKFHKLKQAFIKIYEAEVIKFIKGDMTKKERLEFVDIIRFKIPYSKKTSIPNIQKSFNKAFDDYTFNELLNSL